MSVSRGGSAPTAPTARSRARTLPCSRTGGSAASPDFSIRSRRAPDKRNGAAVTTAAAPFVLLSVRSRGAGGVALGLDSARQQPAEIGQRGVRADCEQLIVRIGIEHRLLRLDDRLVLVERLFK